MVESEVELDCVSKSITYQWCHYQVHIMCRHLAFAELGHWYFDLIFVIIKQESRFSEFMLGCFCLWTLEIHFGSISSYPGPLIKELTILLGFICIWLPDFFALSTSAFYWKVENLIIQSAPCCTSLAQPQRASLISMSFWRLVSSC